MFVDSIPFKIGIWIFMEILQPINNRKEQERISPLLLFITLTNNFCKAYHQMEEERE